jgi:hypothetical protein
MNPFRKRCLNPDPLEMEPPEGSHSTIWKFLIHLDKAQAVTDERVRFNTWAVTLTVGLHMASLGILVTILL